MQPSTTPAPGTDRGALGFAARTARALGAVCLALGLASTALAEPPEEKLTPPASGGVFGGSVDIDGDLAVVGEELGGAAYVFVRCGGAWELEATLRASDAAVDDQFGTSVAVSGDTAIVGALFRHDAGDGRGAAYVFTRDASGTWTQQQKLVASDAAADDRFGCAVEISGGVAFVGARLEDDGGDASGAAYVFARDDTGAWSEQQKLVASDAEDGDQFGVSVAISGDSAFVGAWFDDDEAVVRGGAAYVYTRNDSGAWTEQQKLVASDAATYDQFGLSVAVSGDTAIVGAHADDDALSSSGSAYVFTRGSSGVWAETQKLVASDAEQDDEFGASVAIAGDIALVGARLEDDPGADSGAAYVFTRSASGTWSEQRKLAASDAAAHDQFGVSVALTGDTALVGAHYDADAGLESGSVYAYSLVTKLVASDAEARDYFGESVDVHGDTAVVGAHASNDLAGTAYVFSRSRTGSWVEQQRLTAAGSSELGTSVAVDGDILIAGAPTTGPGESGAVFVFARDAHGAWSQERDLRASGSSELGARVALADGTAVAGSPGNRAAYVFTRDTVGTWSEPSKLTPSDGRGSGFGLSVAVSGDTALVGAPRDDENGAGSGAVYVFVRDGTGTWTESAKLTSFDAAADDAFGTSVAVSGDTAVVGASGDESGGGSAYVFTLDALGLWNLEQKLRASEGLTGDAFGGSVAVFGDMAVVGASRDAGPGSPSGAAYVFTRSSGVWTEHRRLTNSDAGERDRFGVAVAVWGGTAIIGADLDDDVTLDAGSASIHTHLGPGAPVEIVTRTLPATSVGALYRAEIRSVGGSKPHGLELVEGALPTPLTLDPDTGVIEGTCASAGSHTFVMRARDLCGETALRLLTVEVEPAPTITTTELPPATRGTRYTLQLRSSGGLGAGLWALDDSHANDRDISLSSAGALDVFPRATGSIALNVLLTDEAGSVARRSYVLHVNPPPAITTTALAPTTSTLPSVWDAAATGGTPPLTWSLASGALPVAGAPDAATGRVSGDALAPGTYDFTLRVTDANGAEFNRALAVVVNALPSITTAELPLAALNRPLEEGIEAVGGTSPHTWSVASGPLPEGLALDAATGALTGSPVALGRTAFRLRYEDAVGAVAERELALAVAPVADVSRGRLKAELPINLLNGTEPISRALELVEGTQLRVKAKFPAAPTPPVMLQVVDARGNLVTTGAELKTKKSGIQLEGLVVPATGRYFVQVVPVTPFEGAVRLSVKVKAPRGLTGSITFADDFEEHPVTVGVLPGSHVSVLIKRGKGSTAEARVHGITLDGDAGELVKTGQRERVDSSMFSLRTPDSGGTLMVTFGGAGGVADWRIRIRPPKGYAYSETGPAKGVAAESPGAER